MPSNCQIFHIGQLLRRFDVVPVAALLSLQQQEIGGETGNRFTLTIYYTAILESLAMEGVIRWDPEKGTTYNDLGQGRWYYTLWWLIFVGEFTNHSSLPIFGSTYNDVIDDGSHTLGQAQPKGMYYCKGGQGRRNITLWEQEIGGEYGNRLTLAIYFTAILESLAMEVVIMQDPE